MTILDCIYYVFFTALWMDLLNQAVVHLKLKFNP